MVKSLVWLGAGLLALGIAGCGDDDGGSDGSGGSGNTGNTGGTGNSGNSGGAGNSGNSGTGNSGNTGNTGNTGGTGGSGGSGGSGSNNPDAATFCGMFDNVCGYGNGYDDLAACTAAYDGYTEARKTCVNEHLGNAEGGAPNQSTHCPHAAGAGPCS